MVAHPHSAEKDPADWSAIIAVFFLALVWHRLGIPGRIYFDELHYVPAARKLLELKFANPEHPLLGKEIIAAAIALLGDHPLYWRIPSALFGAFGLFAFARLMWFATGSRYAALSGQFLLATGFAWFIQSRIAMLDMFMACFGMIALWNCAAAMRLPHQGRWRLALAGLFFGLAMGVKWSILPVAIMPGLAFLLYKLRANGLRQVLARSGGLVPGISLAEAAVWLGLVPLAVYWTSFAPAFFYVDRPVDPLGFVAQHKYMLELQDSVRKHHTYASVWYEWIANWRCVWYLYEHADGAQRGVLLIGNPFTMLAGLPAVLWCLWTGLRQRRGDALAFAVLYLACMAFWAVSSKPIQFYYHYLLPGTFLIACLALALDNLRRSRTWQRWLAPAALTVSAGMFVYFYPIISAAVLHGGKSAFVQWMWLASWR